MKKIIPFALIVAGCVGQDVLLDEVPPEVRITNPISTMEVNTSYQFEHMFLDNVGMETEPSSVLWTTSDMSKLTIDNTGLAQALDNGMVTVSVFASTGELEADTSITFEITGDPTMMLEGDRSGTIATTSSYVLEGDFVLSEDGEDLIIDINENYRADDNLPGLYVYLTNNPNSPSGGYEIGPVQVFSGAHQYVIPEVDIFEYDYLFYYCKPFKVKVGHGEIE
ncbi:Ig-like domain-containing protein [Ekhidna sp.]|uniref:Ig-like domain-containing protein n=1 Tax=Ekhidna sp. TaxID=2608089 RepID=UPI003CCBC7B8